MAISYSKRTERVTSCSPNKKRPYIGRKGIGKLAMLSCSQKVHILTRKSQKDEYVSACIDNKAIDDLIAKGSELSGYSIGGANIPENSRNGHGEGTILYFEGLNDSVRNTAGYIRKMIALYFRFSLLDKYFKIHFNSKEITDEDLAPLIEKTQYFWKIGDFEDSYLNRLGEVKKVEEIKSDTFKGFIASVKKPGNLTSLGLKEEVGVDLFVNGRVREKNITRYNNRKETVSSYIYGQIHCDHLDGDNVKDLFTSARDSVCDGEEKDEIIKELDKILSDIFKKWNELRKENKSENDTEEKYASKLFKKVVDRLVEDIQKELVEEETQGEKWVKNKLRLFSKSAGKNLVSYTQCFVVENLLRAYICEKHPIPIEDNSDLKKQAEKYKKTEDKNKKENNISIDIRKNPNNQFKDDNLLPYLGAEQMANHLKMFNGVNDFKVYSLIRNALAHTAFLTDDAIRRFKETFDKIEDKFITIINDTEENSNS